MEKSKINLRVRHRNIKILIAVIVFFSGSAIVPATAAAFSVTSEAGDYYTCSTTGGADFRGHAYGTPRTAFSNLYAITEFIPDPTCDPIDYPGCSDVVNTPANRVGESGPNVFANQAGTGPVNGSTMAAYVIIYNDWPVSSTDHAVFGPYYATCTTPPPYNPGICGPQNGTATLSVVPDGRSACTKGLIGGLTPSYNCTASFYDSDPYSDTYGQTVCYQWGTTVVSYNWWCSSGLDGVNAPAYCAAPYLATGCINSKDASGNPLTVVSGASTNASAGGKFKVGNYCFGNSGGSNYFVPTNTTAEFMTFWNNIGAGLNLSGIYKIN